MPTTPNMNLDLPVVSTTSGPQWATAVNEAFDEVDTHDHSTGNGVKITPTGLNINADLPLNENNVTEVRSVRFEDQGTVQTEPTDLGCLQLVGGDLWWVNGNGTGVQITSGAGLSFASLGTIGGDFGQPGVTASVTYSDTTKIFSFLQDSGITAGLYGSKILIADASSGALAVTITADAATGAYTLTLPVSAPTDNTVLTFSAAGVGTFRTLSGTAGEVTVTPSSGAHTVSLPATITKNLTFSGTHAVSGASTFSGDTSFTGLTSGRGIVPLGAVLATFPSLTGAYACSATTAADSFGFVQCAGQTLVDATSTMNGAVIPNINNDVFLRGNATSGSTGGATSVTLIEANLPSHTHTINNATVPSSTHTHDYAHVHQWLRSTYSAPLNSFAAGTVATGQNSVFPGTTVFIYNEANNYAAGSNKAMLSSQSTNRDYYTGGPLDSSASVSANTGTPSATQTVSANNTGSGTSFSILPSYITARYVMRVK